MPRIKKLKGQKSTQRFNPQLSTSKKDFSEIDGPKNPEGSPSRDVKLRAFAYKDRGKIAPRKVVQDLMSSPVITEAEKVFEIYFDLDEKTGQLVTGKFTHHDIQSMENKSGKARRTFSAQQVDHLALILSQGIPAPTVAKAFDTTKTAIYYYLRQEWFKRRMDEYTVSVGLATKAGRLREAYTQYNRIRGRASMRDQLDWLKYMREEAEGIKQNEGNITNIEQMVLILKEKPLDEVAEFLKNLEDSVVDAEVAQTSEKPAEGQQLALLPETTDS